METIEQFLKYIHGENKSEIRVYKYWEEKKRKVMCPISLKQIPYENKNGDIYYIVNSGGKRDNQITKYNASFVDFDCGRDQEDNYYSLDIVDEYKEKKLSELSEFSLKPTLIIETRNGYHVYWVYHQNEDTESFKWIEIQEKLIKKFDGDERIKNPARLMRVPFTKWMKDADNPFNIKIIEFNDIRYSVEDIDNSLNDIIIDNVTIRSPVKNTKERNPRKGGYNSNNNNSFNILSTLSQTTENLNVSEDNNYNINAIRNRDVEYLKKKINNNPIEFDNETEFWQYVYRIDISELLELKHPLSFKCIIHKDNSPSASVYQNENGIWLYTCHSGNCILSNFKSHTINIKQLIEILGNFKSEYKAIKFIKEIYNLSIKETLWSIEQKANLDSISNKIETGAFYDLCPQTDKNIRYIRDLFRTIIQIAKENVYSENYCNSDGDAVFFFSLSELGKRIHMSPTHLNRLSQRIAVLAYHDLIRKLDDDKIPEILLKKAQAISINKGLEKRVNFYLIPSWVFEQLNKIESQGIQWKNKGYTLKGVSYEMFFRGEGKEVAQHIYPQHKKVKSESIDYETGEIFEIIQDRTTNKSSDIRVEKIVESIERLINKKNYTTEKELIYYLSKEYPWEVTENQLRKMRGNFEKLGYRRIRANKDEKEKYGIASTGYPIIIIKMQ